MHSEHPLMERINESEERKKKQSQIIRMTI